MHLHGNINAGLLRALNLKGFCTVRPDESTFVLRGLWDSRFIVHDGKVFQEEERKGQEQEQRKVRRAAATSLGGVSELLAAAGGTCASLGIIRCAA